MTQHPVLTLHDGTTLPQVGFGTWQLSEDTVREIVPEALAQHYAHIDTAKIYGNEAAVGSAIAAALAEGTIRREDLRVVTKLWNDDQSNVRAAVETSLTKLQLDYIDLYLLHWPCPAQGTYVEAYREMLAAKEAGLVRSVGVCNFPTDLIDELIEATGVAPSVNQVEIHPGFNQDQLVADMAERGIAVEAWSPLGQGKVLDSDTLRSIAEAHSVTPAQVALRWLIQRGLIVLPRTSNPGRVAENADLFGFELSAEEMDRISALDEGEAGRIGPDPRTFERDATPA